MLTPREVLLHHIRASGPYSRESIVRYLQDQAPTVTTRADAESAFDAAVSDGTLQPYNPVPGHPVLDAWEVAPK